MLLSSESEAGLSDGSSTVPASPGSISSQSEQLDPETKGSARASVRRAKRAVKAKRPVQARKRCVQAKAQKIKSTRSKKGLGEKQAEIAETKETTTQGM
jgi:hypothetical protein